MYLSSAGKERNGAIFDLSTVPSAICLMQRYQCKLGKCSIIRPLSNLGANRLEFIVNAIL